ASLFGGLQPIRGAGNLVARAWYMALAVLAVPLIIVRRPTPQRILLVLSALLVLVLSSGGKALAYDYIFNFSRQLFLLPIAGVVVLFLEWDTNSRWEPVLLQMWLWIGALVGVAWMTYQLIS
ncbi:MAG: hypothetical protein K8R59_08635, partial [Thermoanaerobaculales bacterium]|nr:hypothetical protein [Thermoanaerobaculales bacterium]